MDCICCGFGAVILLYVLMDGQSPVEQPEEVKDLSAEVDKIQRQILEGRKNLIDVRNTIDEVEEEVEETQGASEVVIKTIKEKKEEISVYDKETIARKEHVNKLKADLKALEEGRKRLEGGIAAAKTDGGDAAREFKGEGDRQYLTGLKVGGNHILILIDASASMLGETMVDIIRRRNLPDEEKLRSAKWRQAVATVDWITTQFPEGSRIQVYTFNETAQPVLESTAGTWIDGRDPTQLDAIVDGLKKTIPKLGTSHHHALRVINEMTPRPDNVFWLVDSLPTMPEKRPLLKKNISGRDRLKYFRSARKLIPRSIPINVILYPMEGDPMAGSAFWRLAFETRGSFFSPSRDWP